MCPSLLHVALDIDKFRDLIHKRREAIATLGNSSSAGVETVELDQTKVGRLSRMDAIQIQQMGLATQRRWKNELNALDAALGRIEKDEYGACNQCGEEINPKRLEIDPAAMHCIRCAGALENR